MRNDISSSDTQNMGITSNPQNLGVALTTQTTGSFRNFMVELQICNSPTSQRNFALCFNLSKLPRQFPQSVEIGKNQRVRLVSPMFAAGEFRKYQPVTAVSRYGDPHIEIGYLAFFPVKR
ncbi:hypothetical protein K3I38_002152 [Escherichia coli]|nr:hypothetical protein [Escherichia coli]